ncbi:MAG TPA: nitroreductase/quinone reductase family protein [Candidatus Limnocylindrales bacterium]|nr:nitroreductase/quinone reductase family protein [Candidatus Limnocylindrales bacterium]
MQQVSQARSPRTDRSPAEAEAIRRLLDRGGLVDITTTGRHSGEPRRIEIVFHNIDGRLIITGRASRRTRAWIHNLAADPRMTLHVKGPLRADLPAHARVITDAQDRRAIADWVSTNAWPGTDPESMAAYSPMIEVTLDEPV